MLYFVVAIARDFFCKKGVFMEPQKFEYEGYEGTVNYDKKCDYYTGEVVIDGRIYTYEGDSLEELREDFEDIIDSMIAFEEMGDEDEDDIEN